MKKSCLVGCLLFGFVIIFLIGLGMKTVNEREARSNQDKPNTKTTPTPETNIMLVNVSYNGLAVRIENLNKSVWSDCSLSVNRGLLHDGYVYHQDLVGKKDVLLIPWNLFTKTDGTRFDYAITAPKNLSIECSVGGHIKTAYYDF